MRQSTREMNPRPATRPEGQNERNHDGSLLPSCRAQAVSTCVALGFRAHPGGLPDREPASMRAVTVRRLVVQLPRRRCVGPVDPGRSPRLDRGLSTVVPGARQGTRARRRSRASRSCRLATRGPKCGPSVAQARATADVSSTPRVRPPSRPPDRRRCPPPYEAPRPVPSGGGRVTSSAGGAIPVR